MRLKSLPSPFTLDVTGAILVGSSIELVSVGLLALSTMACPLESILESPLIWTRSGCGVSAVFTTFK